MTLDLESQVCRLREVLKTAVAEADGIDNGYCVVCRFHRLHDLKGNVGVCSNQECPSHQWKQALASTSGCGHKEKIKQLMGFKTVAGGLEITIAEFIRSCEVHIEEEQAKPNCDNALLSTLCNGIRLAREYCDSMKFDQLSVLQAALNEAEGKVRLDKLLPLFTLAETQLLAQGLHILGEQNRVDKKLISVWSRLRDNLSEALVESAKQARKVRDGE